MFLRRATNDLSLYAARLSGYDLKDTLAAVTELEDNFIHFTATKCSQLALVENLNSQQPASSGLSLVRPDCTLEEELVSIPKLFQSAPICPNSRRSRSGTEMGAGGRVWRGGGMVSSGVVDSTSHLPCGEPGCVKTAATSHVLRKSNSPTDGFCKASGFQI